MKVAGLAVWGEAQRRTKLTDEQVPLPLSTLASALPPEQGTIGPDHRHRPKRFRPLCPPVDGVDTVDRSGQRWMQCFSISYWLFGLELLNLYAFKKNG